MTNPVRIDNLLAQTVPKDQNLAAANTDGHRKDAPTAPSSGRSGEQTDVNRAHQRLSQETGAVREPAIQSMAEARRQIASFKAQLDADPQAGLNAHGRIGNDKFEAAMARPTA